MVSQTDSDLNTDWYATRYPDVRGSGLSAERHYEIFGKKFHRKKNNNDITRATDAIGGDSLIEALVPLNQLERKGPFVWESLGDDPFYAIDLSKIETFAAGWYLFFAAIDAENPGLAKFYFDYGNDFDEKSTVVLPYENGITTQRVVKIDGYVEKIRFDPKEDPGEFSIKKLSYIHISSATAFSVISQRLADIGIDVTVPEQIAPRSDLGGVSPDYFSLYEQTFLNYKTFPSYKKWMEIIEIKSEASELDVLRDLRSFQEYPLISIIIPVYNTAEIYLRKAIESVRMQSYPYWQLCIADDCSPDQHVRRVLDEYMAQDKRINVTYRAINGHISAATNSALSLAVGEYIAFLDHDDELSSNALYYVAKEISKNPKLKILYSDEDKIDEMGRRFQPHFKGDLNLDLLYSQNYISHLSVYKRSLVERVGRFRLNAGVDGCQDYDLLLRCLALIDKSEIKHIPRILYHWRAISGSTALGADQKTYTNIAGVKALTDYFASQNLSGIDVSNGISPNTYRVRWPIPSSAPFVSLIMPTRDGLKVTETAVRSILDKSTYKNYELLIIDNGSVQESTLKFFEKIQEEDERVKVLRYDRPFNYSELNNYGVRNSRGSIVGLINNDVEIINSDWLTEMVSQVWRPEIGCVGAKLYYSNTLIQHGGVILGIGGVAGHAHKYFPKDHPGYFDRLRLVHNLSAVTAACLLVRKSVYEEVGGLNELNLKVAFNDVDFCLKVDSKGYRNLWTPYAELFHYESISRGAEDNPEKVKRFNVEIAYMLTTWGEKLRNDRYYSQHLSRDKEDFSINVSVNS